MVRKLPSEHAFWSSNVPGYSEWPAWFQRQFDRSCDPTDDRVAEVAEFLNRGGRKRLEEAGGLPICQEAQLFLIGLLSIKVELLRPPRVNHKKRKLAKAAEALADEIETNLVGSDFNYRTPSIELPLLLRRCAHLMDPAPGITPEQLFDTPGPKLSKMLRRARARRSLGRPGRPAGDYNDLIIEAIAELYHVMGGRVAYSPNGPFGNLLKVIWEILPPKSRSATAATFARRAKRLVPALSKILSHVPRRVAGKPLFDTDD